MTVALRGLEGRLAAKAVQAAIKEGVQEDAPPATRLLAIYAMAALDDPKGLIARLDDDNPAHAPDRAAAVFALRRWISRTASHGRVLYTPDRGKGGLLLERKWRLAEVGTLFDLLHDFSDEDRRSADTYEALAGLLESRRVAIAEVAFWHLRRMAPQAKLAEFNAALPRADRKRFAGTVRELIEKRKLPPPPPRAEDKE
jgi:hypothetical protein